MSVAEVIWPDGDTGAATAFAQLGAAVDWLWVHSPGGRPRDDALPTLLAVAAALDDAPVMLAALVVDASGTPRADRLPAGREADTAAAIAGVERRVLPMRSAPFAGLLVRADAVHAGGPPDVAAYGPHAPLVWTARLLADRPGYLVPAAVVVESDDRERARLGPTLRTVRSGVWTAGESVRALLKARIR
jgi:hypothetical protein